MPSFVFFMTVLTGVMGCADKVIFQPPESFAGFDQNLLDLLEVSQSDGVKIAMYYQPAQPGKPTILYSHGNAEDLSYLVPFLQHCFARTGYGVAAYDYEGYGRSGGTPSEDNTYRDVEAMWRYLTEERKIPPQEIIIYGRSVGSGPATYLASRKQAAGLVLEAPFSSAFEVANLGWLPFNRFENYKLISEINQPLLIIHGTNDKVIPLWHGKKLYDLAGEPKFFYSVPGAGHNNIFPVGGDVYLKKLDEFAAFCRNMKK